MPSIISAGTISKNTTYNICTTPSKYPAKHQVLISLYVEKAFPVTTDTSPILHRPIRKN
jgi:hypothetical protein